MSEKRGVPVIKAIRNPDIYHGNNKKSNFFEGWYFKIVQPRTGHTYCFIPGVFISSEEGYSHSFIQVLKGNENNFKYLRFKKDQFKASTFEFNLKVEESSFSLNQMTLNINQQYEKISGTLYFDNIIRWPDSIINPGSMGFYNYLGFMQCYSQVCAVDGIIRGKLSINDETVDFTGGKLYIEKNWGRSFPYSYIWVQGNSFEKGDGSVTCSIGHIPLPFRSFIGFLIGIYAKGRFYKFTTINKSTLSINCENEKIVLETYNKDYSLKIEAFYKQETFMDLYAPYDGNMIPIASETLHGNLKVTLYDKKRSCLIFNDNCSSAGIELSENYINLINKIERR
ncbi:tocopherol cyclase family protein [Clostridium sp.]|uniref:tocopherol cyclase family protein n=1 Tax=Clostridium sp. TaxID=1506 RepID=UPI00283EE690|nr:tocopherol cyclase family protein [Clostridium sp.]MDR3594063.1 tocopherol cyclase family protein [Clostridium sp.]